MRTKLGQWLNPLRLYQRLTHLTEAEWKSLGLKALALLLAFVLYLIARQPLREVRVIPDIAETIIAAKNESTKDLSAEITDLLYHLLVLMVERGVSLRDILGQLGKRAGRPAEPKHQKRDK